MQLLNTEKYFIANLELLSFAFIDLLKYSLNSEGKFVGNDRVLVSLTASKTNTKVQAANLEKNKYYKTEV